MVNVSVPPASVVTRPEVGVTEMPAVSLSMLVRDTSVGFKPLYVASALLAAPVIMLYVTSPSSIGSSMPVIVIVCATLQFDDVNVTLEAEIVPSAVLLLLSAI